MIQGISTLLVMALSLLSLALGILFKHERKEHDRTEKALKKAEGKAKALEIKNEVEATNRNDKRDIRERMHEKGYLRD